MLSKINIRIKYSNFMDEKKTFNLIAHIKV